MEKYAECVDPDTAADVRLVGTQYISGADENVRDPEALAVLRDELVLFDLGEAVGVPSTLWMLFDRTALVQKPAPWITDVRVDGERAETDESP